MGELVKTRQETKSGKPRRDDPITRMLDDPGADRSGGMCQQGSLRPGDGRILPWLGS